MARRFVAAVTLGLAAAAVGLVLRFGTNVPVVDEWDLLPDVRAKAAAGDWPGWVLDRHNEHYFPAGRLVLLAALPAGGWDLRAAMLTSVGLLTAAAGLFARAAAAARGRASVGDAVLPALLLNWGQAYNLLMGYQVVFTLLPAAAGWYAWEVVRDAGGRRAGVRQAAAAGLVVLGGGMGLGFAPGLAAALLVRGWVHRRTGGLGVAVPAAVLLVGYVGWAAGGGPGGDRPAFTPLGLVLSAAQFLAVGLGGGVVEGPWGWLAVAVVGFYVLTTGLLLRAARHPAGRVAAAGLLALLAGTAASAAGVAWARGLGLVDRYATLSAVGLCAGWVAVARLGPRPAVSAFGLAAAAAVVAFNLSLGWRVGATFKMHNRAIEAAVGGGLPAGFVAARFGGLPGLPYDRFPDCLDRLRRVRHGAFAGLRPDPPLAAVPVPDPVALSVPGCDVPGFLAGPPAVPVPPPGRRVVGLRLRYELDRAPSFLELGLGWAGGEARVTLVPRAGPGETRFWVDAEPAAVTLRPLCPTFGVRVTAADWLVER